MHNPFNPAPGAMPERIVGRGAELAAIREAVRRATGRSAPLPLVFLGQRGMGKTVLLRTLRDAGDRSTVSLAIEALPGRPFVEAVRDKVEAIIDSVDTLPSKVAHAAKKTLAALPKLSYELPHDGGAIAVEANFGEHEPAHQRSLAALLETLRVAACDAKRYLTITLDEMQDADIASMQTLVRFVHESAQGTCPVLLACAGLNESYNVLEKMRTYVQRWATFELRFLSIGESVEAIREPILAANATIEDPAVDRLVLESDGYPFFIQVFASGAWDAHSGRVVRLADVERSLPALRARNELNFYARPLARMSPRETLFALALADLGPGPHDIGAVARSLDATAPDVSSIRATLVRKAIVGVPIPGKVEFRIPFTDRYLRDHRDDFYTRDVTAYREALARRLEARR